MVYRNRYYPPLSIESNQLPSGVVTEDKIAAGAVTGDEIEDGAVGTPDLAANAVTSVKIADGAITSSKIAAGAVIDSKLATQPLTRPLVPAITTDEIADGAVTSQKMASSIIDTPQLVDGAVTTDKLDAAAVDSTKIAVNAVTSTGILDGAVGADELGTDAVETVKIKDGAVTDPKLATDSVITVKIKDANVTLAKMAPLSVDTPQLLDDSVTEPKIADGAVTADKLGADHLVTFLRDNPLFYDDFIGTTLLPWWTVTVDPGGSAIPVVRSLLALATGGGINDIAKIDFGGIKSISFGSLPNMLTRIGFQGIADLKFEVGLLGGPNEYLLFRFDTSVSPNWFAVARNGGAETATDTGIPATTALIDLRVDYNSAAEAKFYIAEVLKATLTTNLPDLADEAEVSAELTSLTAAIDDAEIDYIAVKMGRVA